MPDFDVYKNQYPSRRNTVYASRGMVCSSLPHASGIGLDILKKGGNAIDAAVAVAAALPLLEPTSNGLGSDAFALVWTEGKLHALNASGRAPKAISADIIKAAGHSQVPKNGWMPVMVPGAPSAWAELTRRFGTMPLKDLLAPAIDYAENGYVVSPNVAKIWKNDAVRLNKAWEQDPAVFGPWRELFTKNGEPYKAGEVFKSPDFAATLRSLAQSNCESYYRGEIMEKMVAFSKATGGWLEKEDFESYHPQWVEPITVNYRGYDVYELPPNGHGITVLMALNLLKGMDFTPCKEDPENWHKMIEAMKLAFVDVKKYVADPRTMKTKVEDMLSDRYADKRRALITEKAMLPQAGEPACGDTVYFCTADNKGNMVSYIQSNYTSFGSGVVVPGTGISLQNRGANFSLDPASDNCLEGGKKSYHTIIPGFLVKDGQPVGPFGVMGAFMQPQGQLQVLVNTIDYGMSPQQALDAPRWQWIGEKQIQLEEGVPEEVARDLRRRGHEVEIISDSLNMGRGQIIWKTENGVLAGGTEPRCDGSAAAW